MPDDVRQAKRIKYLIGDKANLIDASAQFDLQNGGYAGVTSADTTMNQQPTQEPLLGQPTQYTQTQDAQEEDAEADGLTPNQQHTHTANATVSNTTTPPSIVVGTTAEPRTSTTTNAVRPIVTTTTTTPSSTTSLPAVLKRKWNRHTSTNSEFLETYQASLLEAREERRAAHEDREEERRAAREERNEDRKEAREFFMQAMSTIAMMIRLPPPSSSPPPQTTPS
mmetsp:Transcript_4212/g.9178  ORF Transcript_4212/g.9178 Transcript_4212/m.9178 type:complete len:224 (+) Transcript_4212:1563-2234(+)